ncbi:MAG: hypothetical protein LBP91_01745 [Coriobacteriales bacterium]|jgi:hypothetical protein|nr:hypothetical protein [Coriobacteriales bacterium]
MTYICGNDTELVLGATEDVIASETPEEAFASAKANKRRARKAIYFAIIIFVLAVAVLITVFWHAAALTKPSAATLYNTTLSRPVSNNHGSKPTSESGAQSAAAASGSIGSDNDTSANGSSGAPGTNNSNSGGSTGGGSGGSGGTTGGGNAGNDQTWHPSWSEQVWVDTSGWQSIFVADNPIFESHSICNTCEAIISGFGAQHIMETLHTGYHSGYVQVGTEPVYEQQWVTSGYWTTITHPGYWG